jgi:hypothetical protein
MLPLALAKAETIGAGMEENTDRPGSDYSSFTITSRDPEACRRACQDDSRCNAWTYVRPGVQGDTAVCYLKSQVPGATASNCCISGKRQSEAWKPSVTDAINQPPVFRDEVSSLRAEVKSLKEQVAALSKAVAALKSHTHQYTAPSFGVYAVNCSALQPGASGKCYVMLDPKSADRQTAPPSK